MGTREIRGHKVIYYYNIIRNVDLSVKGMYKGEYKYLLLF